MSKQDYGFKFEIGQLVRSIGYVVPKEDDFKRWARTQPDAKFQIIERLLQECPGGVQRHYGCRTLSDNGHTGPLVQINEITLVAIQEEKGKEDESADI